MRALRDPDELVLFEHPGASSPLNHLGVEMSDTDDVTAAAARFAAAGLEHRTTESDVCCHAVQDKVWVDAPDVPLGAWEFYTIIADAPTATDGASTCCATHADSTVCCTEPDTAAAGHR